MKIIKGDTVKILLGKDRGKTGRVLRVLPKSNLVLVEGINSFKRHVRKTGGMQGGIIDITKPVNLSNLMIVCPSCKMATRVGFKIGEDGKQRICRKCKKEL